MTPRPFRFGLVAAATRHTSDLPATRARAWTATAQRAESAGFATLLVPDTAHTLSSLPACVAAAAATSTLRVGSYVLSAPNRTPGQAAADVVAVHVLSGGRFELGIGAGRPGAERDAEVLGMPFGAGPERLRRLEDTVVAVREQAPGVPVLIAGSGPRLLALAGRVADTVAFGLPPQAAEQQLSEAVARVRDAAGERSHDLELSVNLLCVGDELPAQIARYQPVDVRALAADGSVSVLTGSVDQMVDRL
jgi:alkanesulfonate monooxygenase SsuD/methylene tetrahydromethanopterin reductase-like flavin-dependent oxidoreductase (luciferase family)